MKKLSGGEAHTTNNRMEMVAVIKGIEAAAEAGLRRIHVVTDSQYVVKGMTEWLDGWVAKGWRRGPKKEPVMNADLWKDLLVKREQFKLTFEHVRGHQGHPENEECDRLAVEAALEYA